jgi:protein TonB
MLRRFGPLSGILLLHVAFFYALNSGLVFQPPKSSVPKEVVATFITPERAPEPPKPQVQPEPPKPKTVPVVKKAAPPPPVPVVNNTPSEKAISAPAPVRAPEPVAAAPAAQPSPPATPAAPAQPKTISSGVEYLQPPHPEYPAASRRMGEEGKAVLRVLVNDKGRAERVDVQKSSGSPRLDEAARQAVQRALFKPYTEDGKAVAVFAIIPISFQLD